MVYALADTLFRAKFAAWGKEEDWEFLGSHSVKDYKANAKLYQGIYNKTAKRLESEGK